VYSQAITNSGRIHLERIQFSKKLIEFLSQNRQVVYLDETTFTNWHTPEKTWMLPNHPIPTVLGKKRLNVTLFGALGTCDGTPLIGLYDSTNSESLLAFLSLLKRKLRPLLGGQVPVLILDNHPAHRSTYHRGLISEFEVLFMPPYSSFLNPVELLWSILKRHLRKSFSRLEHNFTSERLFRSYLSSLIDDKALDVSVPRVLQAGLKPAERYSQILPSNNCASGH
jgi:transposase